MKKRPLKFPKFSAILLGAIALICVTAPLWDASNPTRMFLDVLNQAPSREYLFGTDSLGRDIFSMIWYGGRISIFIGLFATVISTGIAMLYGTVSGLANDFIDSIMMRAVELLLSIPSILYVISIQAILGSPTPLSISIVIGLTSWMNISKMVRAEVLRVRRSEYVISAKMMGGSFIYVLRKHLLPNFLPAVMFMIVSNIGQAIATEATLSFIGIGLPVDVISWGSLMSLSEKALLTSSWWIIIVPGLFMVTTLVCITNLGEYHRRKNNITQTWL